MRFFNFSSFVSRKLKYLFIKLPSVYLAPVYDLISVILYPNNNLHSMPICCCLPAVDWPSQETRGLLVFQTYFFLYFPLDNQDQLCQPKQDQPLFPEMASCTYPLKEISLSQMLRVLKQQSQSFSNRKENFISGLFAITLMQQEEMPLPSLSLQSLGPMYSGYRINMLVKWFRVSITSIRQHFSQVLFLRSCYN